MADDHFAVFIEGVDLNIEGISDEVRKAARIALNATARRAIPAAARSMEQQINFPRGYLSGQNARLGIAKYAKEDDLEAVVRGRDRPTSLARFVSGGAKPGKKERGVTVQVKPGVTRRIPSAFAIKLRNGNVGLAYRTKDGRPPNSIGAKQMAPGLWLLYGPSVDQVFNKTREYIADDLGDFQEREFRRVLDLKL